MATPMQGEVNYTMLYIIVYSSHGLSSLYRIEYCSTQMRRQMLLYSHLLQ